jgi:diguanylate cyclase (GGDEF)-like protein
MSDQVSEDEDVARLVEEISRLRGQVAQLQERVEQLDHLAHQDSLIDLPNRRGFLRELERLIARVSRYDAKGAMLFVDVDGLKAINDSFGHRAGDEALIEVAELLTKGVRKSDVVARIGGDEFGILLENADENSAHETAGRLIDLIATASSCTMATSCH